MSLRLGDNRYPSLCLDDEDQLLCKGRVGWPVCFDVWQQYVQFVVNLVLRVEHDPSPVSVFGVFLGAKDDGDIELGMAPSRRAPRTGTHDVFWRVGETQA